MKLLLRVIVSVLIILQLVILLGLALQGVSALFSGFLMTDRAFGAAYAALGVIFGGILIKSALPFLKREGHRHAREWVSNNATSLIIITALWLLLIVLQSFFFNHLVYGGYILGGILVTQARLGILQILPLDLLDFGGEYLAWIVQWYYIAMIVGWIKGIVDKRKFRKRPQ